MGRFHRTGQYHESLRTGIDMKMIHLVGHNTLVEVMLKAGLSESEIASGGFTKAVSRI